MTFWRSVWGIAKWTKIPRRNMLAIVQSPTNFEVGKEIGQIGPLVTERILFSSLWSTCIRFRWLLDTRDATFKILNEYIYFLI